MTSVYRWLLLLLIGAVWAGEVETATEALIQKHDQDFLARAKKYLAEKSTSETDAAWRKKLQERVSQKAIDSGQDTNAALNQIILDWGSSKDFARLSDKELAEAARWYLVYRDQEFSPFTVARLQLPERILELLREQKIAERFLKELRQ